MEKKTKKTALAGKKEISQKVLTQESPKTSSKKIWVAGIVALIIVGALIVSQMCCPFGDKTQNKTSEKGGVVVAVVAGEKVRMGDLEQIKNAIPQLRDMPMNATLYNKLLEAFVNNKVILNAAKQAGVQNQPAVKKMLEDNQDQILFQAYLTQKLKEKMTPEKLQAIYQRQIKDYVPEEEIHARHILVETEKEAKDLIVKLKAGANFEELANKYSKDKNPNFDNGGDLGYFRKGMMIPEFANAAFAIKKGQISEKPIRTPFGWHVVKVEDKRQASAPTIGEMSEEIKAKFTEETIPTILAEERQKANVVILDPLGLNKVAPEAEAPAKPAPVMEEPVKKEAKPAAVPAKK